MGLNVGTRPPFERQLSPPRREDKTQQVSFVFEEESVDGRYSTDTEHQTDALESACGRMLDDLEIEAQRGGTLVLTGVNKTPWPPSRLLFEVWWRSLKNAAHDRKARGNISWKRGEIVEEDTDRDGVLSKLLPS